MTAICAAGGPPGTRQRRSRAKGALWNGWWRDDLPALQTRDGRLAPGAPGGLLAERLVSLHPQSTTTTHDPPGRRTTTMMRDMKLCALAALVTLALVFTCGGYVGNALVQLGGRFQNAAQAVVVHEYDDTLPVAQAQTRRR